MAGPKHRPSWLRVDRLSGVHGIQKDTAAGRGELVRRMEERRRAEPDEREWAPLRRAWYLGG